MSIITVSSIEQGLVDRLESQMAAEYGASVSSYAGQLEDAMRGIEVDVPAVLVAFDGAVREDAASTFDAVALRMVFSVTVMARSFRSSTDARTDSAAGAYALAQSVQSALHQNDLGLDGFSGLHFQSMQLALARKTLVAYRLEYYCYAEQET